MKLRRVLPALLWLFLASACQAQGPANTLWQGHTPDGRKLGVLGSVHVLRASDYPLPPAIMEAYAEADTLVLELDMADVSEAEVARAFATMGVLEQGALSDGFSDTEWQRALEMASELEIPLERMQQLKPWLASLTVLQLRIAQLGFDPDLGLDQHLAELAKSEAKPVLGLETLEQQLGLFDGMSETDQRAMLLQSLEEASGLADDLEQMIDDWRRGRVESLAKALGESFADYPALYDSLVVRRNRAWSRQIVNFGPAMGNVLVVVGALHLVGEHSLVELLREQGLELRQR